MEQTTPLNDSRLDYGCTYCGGLADTRDHVPSKILLNTPFPENLPVVSCCFKCNQGFSLDEEYISCLLECIIHATIDISKISNDDVKRILSNKPSLLQRISNGFQRDDKGKIAFTVEENRLKNVIIKLARGHIRYEHSTTVPALPDEINIKFIHLMTEAELKEFIQLEKPALFPEIGSRGFLKSLILSDRMYNEWQEVQSGVYEYAVESASGFNVKILIKNYMAVEVYWSD